MIEDNDPQLLDEAIRLCNEVARSVREANTYYRNRQRHVSRAGEYGAGLAELCAERIAQLQAIRRGELTPKPTTLAGLFLATQKPPSNAEGKPTPD